MTSDTNLNRQLQRKNENIFSIGPLMLTDEDRARRAAGELQPWLEVSKEDAGNFISKTPLGKPWFGLSSQNSPAGFLLNKANEIQADENASGYAHLLANTGEAALTLPNNLIDAAKNGFNYITDSAAAKTGLAALAGASPKQMNMVQEAHERPQREAMHQQQQAMLQQQAENEMFFHALGNGVQQFTGGSQPSRSSSVDLGPAPSGGDVPAPVDLPAPPPAQDFSQVQEMIERTRPEERSDEYYQEQRKNAMIVGALGALSNGNADSIGEGIAMAASGMFAGGARADQAKLEAKQKFKEQMNNYWMKMASVKRNEAESEEQYARRVWQNDVNQLKLNYQNELKNWEENKPQTFQSGSNLVTMYEDKNGRRVADIIDIKKTDRNAKLIKSLIPLVGEDKAKSIAVSLSQGKMNRTKMTDIMTQLMIANGKISEFASVNDEIKETLARANEVSQGFQVADDKTQKQIAEDYRRTIIMEMMIDQPALFNLGMQLSGIKNIGR